MILKSDHLAVPCQVITKEYPDDNEILVLSDGVSLEYQISRLGELLSHRIR